MRLNGVKHTANEVKLSTREFQLISYLSKHKWKTLKKEDITKAVWGEAPNANNLVVLIKAIRAKLPVRIETVYGVGYRYQGEDYQKSNPF